MIDSIITDLHEIVATWDIDDMITFALLVVWVGWFLIPLSQIDKRDHIVGLTYCLYSLFGAMLLGFVAAPDPIFPADARNMTLTAFAIVSITWLRWFYRPTPVREKIAITPKEEKKANG